MCKMGSAFGRPSSLGRPNASAKLGLQIPYQALKMEPDAVKMVSKSIPNPAKIDPGALQEAPRGLQEVSGSQHAFPRSNKWSQKVALEALGVPKAFPKPSKMEPKSFQKWASKNILCLRHIFYVSTSKIHPKIRCFCMYFCIAFYDIFSISFSCVFVVFLKGEFLKIIDFTKENNDFHYFYHSTHT